jgi:rRNA maturation endonuclease Nob1
LTVEINWTEEEHAEISIICDACTKEYVILSREITNLHLCSFCGHYLDMPLEEDTDEKAEDSWY